MVLTEKAVDRRMRVDFTLKRRFRAPSPPNFNEIAARNLEGW